MASRYRDAPADITAAVRASVAHLPEVVEQKAWAGVCWQVRRRTFVRVLDFLSDDGEWQTVLSFRASAEEFDVLCNIGAPFHRAGWGPNVMLLALDGNTDWHDVRELMTESFCVMAPKSLAESVGRPAST